jgi:glycosyltransferase involved in cell wall biosynthesis
VFFAGQVSDAELHRWLKTARLVLILSEQEAFGLQVLEGAAAGLPVVASDIPAHREAGEYVGDRGVTFVSPEGSPLEVADAIRSALEIPTPPPVRPLPSWADVVDRTLGVYDDVLRRPPVNGARAPRFGRPQRLEQGGRSGAAIEG